MLGNPGVIAEPSFLEGESSPAVSRSRFTISILFLPVVNCHFEVKDSGPEEHADYETDGMPSSTIVEEGDES